MRKIPFIDLKAMSPEQRLKIIAHSCLDHKMKVGFVVDKGKEEIYLKILKEEYPDIEVTFTGNGPVDGTFTITVQPKSTVN